MGMLNRLRDTIASHSGIGSITQAQKGANFLTIVPLSV